MSPNEQHSISVFELPGSFRRNCSLILQMTKCEVIERYRVSVLGVAWSFFNPLIMLAIYTLVFSTVVNAKWGGGSDSRVEFAEALFTGMIFHGVLAKSMFNSPSLLFRNVSYVKKDVFSRDVTPLIVIGAALFYSLIGLLVWMLFYIVINQSVQLIIVLLTFVFFLLVMFSLGVSWILASLEMYIDYSKYSKFETKDNNPLGVFNHSNEKKGDPVYKESYFAWKNSGEFDFLNLSRKLSQALLSLG